MLLVKCSDCGSRLALEASSENSLISMPFWSFFLDRAAMEVSSHFFLAFSLSILGAFFFVVVDLSQNAFLEVEHRIVSNKVHQDSLDVGTL